MADTGVPGVYKQGAEGRLIIEEYKGKNVIVKERFSKKYRHHVLDKSLTTRRTKAEAKYLKKCKDMGIFTPEVYHVDTKSSKIYLEYFPNSITVRDHLKTTMNNSLSSEQNQLELHPLMEKIGTTLGNMHQHNIVHGDLTTSNMLLKSSDDPSLVMIDFGLAGTATNTEEKGVDLYVLERAFLSTHPNTDHFMHIILKSYENAYPENGSAVLKKLDEVRQRGRKKSMIG